MKKTFLIILASATIIILISAGFIKVKQIKKSPINSNPKQEINNSTSNWKTLTTSSFSIKYPESWNEPKLHILSTRVEYDFDLEHFTIVEGSYYDQSLGRPRNYKEELELAKKGSSKVENTNVGGVTAVKYTFDKNIPQYTIILQSKDPKQGEIFWLTMMNIDKDENKKIFDELLSTFQFVDNTQNSSFCGGFAGIACPKGYSCLLDGNFPDAGGTCVKNDNAKPQVYF